MLNCKKISFLFMCISLRWRIFVQKRREKRIYENLAFYSPWQAILLNTPRISSGAISPFVAYKKHCSLTKTTGNNSDDEIINNILSTIF